MAATPYATLTEVKQYMGKTGSGDDAVLTVLIGYVSGIIDDILNIKYQSTQITEYQDGSGTDTVLLNNRPITSVSNLYEDTGGDFGASSEISSDDFIVYEEAGMIRLRYTNFQAGKESIKIIYSAGWTSSTAPQSLKLACIKGVSKTFKLRNTEGISAKSFVDGSVSYFSDKIFDEMDLKAIQRYAT